LLSGISRDRKEAETLLTSISEELAKDPWIKVVGMLQQNWAVIVEQDRSALVVFYNDHREVFDEIEFSSAEDARIGLMRNGFSKYRDNPKFREFIAIPDGDFVEGAHPNGRIYSSGEYWI
jgi:hypothetical protein